MAWLITQDNIEGGTPDSQVGNGQGQITGRTFNFRLMDDDGQVYYYGRADQAAVDDDEADGGLYQANRWGEWYAGAVWLQVRARDGWRLGLVAKQFHPNPNEWVTVYS